MISAIRTDTGLDRLAASGGGPSSPLRDFIENGGSISFVRGAPLAGLPLTPDGAPDFERIIAVGGMAVPALLFRTKPRPW